MSRGTVGPVARAVLGAPEPCPVCGGRLVPAFGEVVDDTGTRRAVMDPTTARCRDCGTLFDVRDEDHPQ